jgi:RHS repeat-associated protein
LVNSWRDTSSTWHSETESYSYDGLDRLTSASCTSWSHTYAYDKVGNRTAKDSVTYTINTVNEVTALSDGTSFTYDANGNRTQKTKGTDAWVYTYDYANRLTKVEENSATLEEYVYDGDGKRIQVTDSSKTTIYIYSGLNVLYEETMNSAATYIYGPTGRIAKRTTINQESNIFYYHTDHLGSTRLVTDENKNVVSASTYHPFGDPDTAEGQEHYLFTGKEKDVTGLYYYGARYYDPEIGRFLTRDPVAGNPHVPMSLNRYSYCLDNPLKYTDPMGLSTDDADDEQSLLQQVGILLPMREEGESDQDYLNRILEFIEELCWNILEKILKNPLCLFTEESLYLIELMSYLEAVVEVLGDDLGISGAFIFIEGMGEALFFGAQGGVCLMYHPNTGWGMYTYKGSVRGFQIGANISLGAGFFTWHGESDRFTFDDWKGEFIGTDFSPVIFTYNKFHNKDSSITGWQVSVGAGIAIGVAGTHLYYSRASDWMIPLALRGIVVPQGG